MITFLRVLRGFCGFIFLMQVLGLLPAIEWIKTPDAVTAEMLVFVAIKLTAGIVCGGAFFGLRILINRLYSKKHGIPHPSLSSPLSI